MTDPRPEPTVSPRGWYDLVIVGSGWEAIEAAKAARPLGRRVAIVPALREDDDPLSIEAPFPSCACGTPRRRALPLTRDKALGQMAADGVQVFRGRAEFRASDVLEVDGQPVPFRKVLLATGSVAGPLDLPGAEQAGCLTPQALLAEPGDSGPRARLAIVGAGPDECALAQALCRQGREVHLVACAPGILPDEDPEAAAMVREQLLRQGVRLHAGCSEVSLERAGNARAVLFARGDRREKLFVDEVLAVPPRRAHLAGLGLDAARVAHTAEGVLVDDRLRTTNRRVLAAGTVCGAEFACPEVARATLRRAVEMALGRRAGPLVRLALPRCVNTDPQIVRLGTSPAQAARQGLDVRTYRASFAELEDADAADRPEGFAAVHVLRRSGRVVGATVVAGRAMELAGVLWLLMARKTPFPVLADAVPCRASRIGLLRLAAERCRMEQPPRPWSALIETVETLWRRWRHSPTDQTRTHEDTMP